MRNDSRAYYNQWSVTTDLNETQQLFISMSVTLIYYR